MKNKDQIELEEKIRFLYLASLVSDLPVKWHLDEIMKAILSWHKAQTIKVCEGLELWKDKRYDSALDKEIVIANDHNKTLDDVISALNEVEGEEE